MPSFSRDVLSRNIFKFIYKIVFPKTHKHNRRFWPYYHVKRDSQQRLQKVYFKKTQVSENTLPQIQNKKLMLVATGPSINTLPHHNFVQPDIDYMGVNGAITLAHVKFKYYVVIDHNFVADRFDLFREILQTRCILFTTARCLDLILRTMPIEDVKCEIKTLEVITRNEVEVFLEAKQPINPKNKAYYFKNGYGFSKDIFTQVFDYFTVAYVALQIGQYLGYSHIFLAGLDMTNFNQPRFYETAENKQPTLLDLHHETVLNAFELAQDYLKQKTQVINLSLNSAILSFPKFDSLDHYYTSNNEPLK